LAEQNTNYVSYLIELAHQGRRTAFFELCEINSKNIFSLIYYLMADLEEAKQISLNVYMHAWDNIKQLKSDQSYLEWVRDLAIKHSMFELNKKGMNPSFKEFQKTSVSQLHLLDRMVISLPDEDRIILVLHDMESFSINDIKKYLTRFSVDEIETKLINAREFLIENL
jgi:DNA-directed RNA polymerase specialized sigma24 family protein